jgi:hypothetical protein
MYICRIEQNFNSFQNNQSLCLVLLKKKLFYAFEFASFNLYYRMKKKFNAVVSIIFFSLSLLFLYRAFTSQVTIQGQTKYMLFYNGVGEKRSVNISNSSRVVSHTANPIHYLEKYPFFMSCKNNYSAKRRDKIGTKLTRQKPPNRPYVKLHNFDYKELGDSGEYHDSRITRAVAVYFPVDRAIDFVYELKWLHRSWTFMQAYEPLKWRTDLVVFIDYNLTKESKDAQFLTDLNCSIHNRRKSDCDPPLCALIDYEPLKRRETRKPLKNLILNYESGYFLRSVDIFSNNSDSFIPFYNYLIENAKSYPNLDSVLIAFDGYEYFSSAKYDFVMRTGKTYYFIGVVN